MEPTLIARLIELRTRLVGEGRVLDQLTVAQAVATLTASEADATRREAKLSAFEAQAVQREREAWDAALDWLRIVEEGDAWNREMTDAIKRERDRRYPLPAGEERCDHKFVDSTRCLKCGWTPPPEPRS